MLDCFNRKIDYLRLSVTDRCNLRCTYCMPLTSEGAPPRELLSFEEITRMVRILAGLGVKRVRLTGGEPLVRRGIPYLVRRLKGIRGIEEILLTTNGLLLKPLARELKEAGLTKINIHIDTLLPEKFRQITRWGDIDRVFEGIEESKRVGFSPIKLNAVIQKGINDDEVEDLLAFAVDNGLILRLIELMPIGPAREMPERFLPLKEIRKKLNYTLLPSGIRAGSGPALYYKVVELNTHVGFISPVSQPFCRNCNRIRISADGMFQDCLAYDGTFSLQNLLRNPIYSDEMIAEEVVSLLQGKREGHNNFMQEEEVRTPCMYGIGG